MRTSVYFKKFGCTNFTFSRNGSRFSDIFPNFVPIYGFGMGFDNNLIRFCDGDKDCRHGGSPTDCSANGFGNSQLTSFSDNTCCLHTFILSENLNPSSKQQKQQKTHARILPPRYFGVARSGKLTIDLKCVRICAKTFTFLRITRLFENRPHTHTHIHIHWQIPNDGKTQTPDA